MSLQGITVASVPPVVHQLIEMERRSFTEAPNIALRRLLGLDEGASAAPAESPARPAGRPESGEDEPAAPAEVPASPAGRSWSGKGVILPHGTELRMEYNGNQHFGQIDNGEWAVEGKRFRSPSAAAGGVALTKSGKHTSLDGWIYWQAKRPGDHRWTQISALRRKAA